jgi:GT2 family glycosyltransferase
MTTYLLSSYQKQRYLGAVLESIRLDRAGKESEVFIIDDGSRDGSWTLIEAFAQANPRVEAIRQDNRGIFAVMNQLLAKGSMPWVRIVDSDDPIIPGSTALLVRAAEQAKAAYAFGDKIEYGPDPLAADALVLPLPDRVEPRLVDDPVAHAIRGYNHIPSCTLISREAVLALKPLPETFISCQDLAIALQIFSRSRVVHVPVPVCHQLVRVAGRLSANEALTFHQTIRLIQLYGRNGFDDHYRRMAASKLISRSMRWARRSARPLSWREWAYLAALRLRLRLPLDVSWDACLDAAAAPLERAIKHPLTNARPY